MARTAATSPSSPARAPQAARVYELFLGYACDEKCLFCSQETAWRARPGPSFDALTRKAYAAFQGGSRILAINGGEPTLYRDLPKLIAFARRLGYPEIHIQSNGIRLGDPDYAETLAEAGLTMARLSVHGHAAELHDAQVRRPGAFEAVLRAVGNLERLGLAMGINVVLNRMNCAALPDFFRFFLGRTPVRDFGIIFPLYEGDMAVHADSVMVSMTEAAEAVRAAFAVFRERGEEPPFLLNFTPCVLPGYESRVLRWSAESAAVYDVGKALIIDPESYVLEHPGEAPKGLDEASREGKMKSPTCARCALEGRCLGFERRYAALFGEGEFRPLTAEPAPFSAGWEGTESWRRMLSAEERAALRA